jgi:hypothetical protein
MKTTFYILILFLFTKQFLGQVNIRKPTGTYFNQSMVWTYTLKVKRNGKVKKSFDNFESKLKSSEKGFWTTNQDTIFITYKKKNETNKYLISDSCLISVDKKTCVYSRKYKIKPCTMANL